MISPWLRSGAVEGDLVLASGSFGGSIRGGHLRPTPRIELATAIGKIVGRTGLWKKQEGKFIGLAPQGYVH